MWRAVAACLLCLGGMNAVTASRLRSAMTAPCLRAQLAGLGVPRARSASCASSAQPPKHDLHTAEGLLLACEAAMNELKAPESAAFTTLGFLHEMFCARGAQTQRRGAQQQRRSAQTQRRSAQTQRRRARTKRRRAQTQRRPERTNSTSSSSRFRRATHSINSRPVGTRSSVLM